VVVPFGAAASPDLTILPVFLAAAVGALIAFAAVTIATMLGLTLFATVGGYQIRSRRAARDRGAGAGWNLVTAAPGSGDT